MMGRVELPFPQTKKDLEGAGLEGTSGAEYGNAVASQLTGTHGD